MMLPHPVTVSDFYLEAILGELRALRAEVKDRRGVQDPAGQPEPPTPARGKLRRPRTESNAPGAVVDPGLESKVDNALDLFFGQTPGGPDGL